MDQSTINSTSEDCPKPKKIKTHEVAVTSQWAYLPYLPLIAVFSMLSEKDRQKASAVCRNWRCNSFHPRWFRSVTFSIQPNKLEKVIFLTNSFGSIVTHVKIVLLSLSNECVREFINLLQQLSRNNNLKTLIIDPSHCCIEQPLSQDVDRSGDLAEVSNLLKMCLPRLSEFSICCKEVLSLCMETIVENLNPSLVTNLRLATAQDDPEKRYLVNYFDPALLTPFTKLEVLSIGYDNVSDEFLDILEYATELKKLIIHFRSDYVYTPVMTKKAWIRFRHHHPATELCLTIIHPHKNMRYLHTKVMGYMPFTTLKCYFRKQLDTGVFRVPEKPGFTIQYTR